MDDWFAQVAVLIAQEPLPVTQTGPADGMRRLCTAATRALSATGAGITVMVNDRLRGVAAVSDTEAERLEELQFTAGEDRVSTRSRTAVRSWSPTSMPGR